MKGAKIALKRLFIVGQSKTSTFRYCLSRFSSIKLNILRGLLGISKSHEKTLRDTIHKPL